MLDIDNIEALSQLSENELLQELDRLSVSIPRLKKSNEEINDFIGDSKDKEEIVELKSIIKENEQVIHKQKERRRVILGLLNKP